LLLGEIRHQDPLFFLFKSSHLRAVSSKNPAELDK
jgi:hypothetical protein